MDYLDREELTRGDPEYTPSTLDMGDFGDVEEVE